VTVGGIESPTNGGGRPWIQPRLSPDGRRVAVAIRGNTSDVWQFEFARETWTRLTFDDNGSFPLWTPDGKRLTYAGGKGQPSSIFLKPIDGSQADAQLYSKSTGTVPLDWSPDGSTLAFVSVDPQTAQDIWMLSADDPGHAKPFLQTRFREGAPTFSPDSRWVAYVSDESGRSEVYVRPYPGPGQAQCLLAKFRHVI
jgi:eukaryotic-like serine/threonine-protein kinase